MKYQYIIFLIVLFCFSSCSRLIMFAVGAEQPKYKTDKQVKKFTQNKLAYDGDILRLSSFSDEDKMPFAITNIPSVMIIEKGEINKFVSTCSADFSDIIQGYGKEDYEPQMDTTIIIEDWSKELYSMSGATVSFEEPTFVIFYATFIGGMLNKRDVLLWMDEITNKSNTPFVLVNVDISEELSKKKN